MYYESQFEYVETLDNTDKGTVTMTTDGENANINAVNGNQYNDASTHNQTGGTVDGESNSDNDENTYSNSHSDET